MFEELEQVPWSQLVAKPRRPGRWAVVAAAVLIALGLLIVRFRAPASGAGGPVVSAPATVPIVVEETDAALMITEADLQARGGSGELLALGAAVVEVRATSTPTHYVEWAVAEGLTPLGQDRWAVQVAFQVLVSGTDGPERTAIRRVDVPIEVVDGRAGRAGPLHLSHYEPGPENDAWEVQATPVTPAMTEAVVPLFDNWGEVRSESAGTHRGLVRVVIDTGAMKVSVWLDDDAVVPAIPAPSPVP